MKNFLISLGLLCLASNAAFCEESLNIRENYVSKWGRLELNNNQLCSSNGSKIQLAGWNANPDTLASFDACSAETQFAQMNLWGAKVVRVTTFANKFERDSDSELLKMKDYIAQSANAGLYCIVNWDILTPDTAATGEGDPNKSLENAKLFFSEISSFIKENNLNHVLYEICSEPGVIPWNSIKEYADSLLPSIADNDPNAVVIVGTPQWNQKLTEASLNPITHNSLQIMYAFQYYACNHETLLGEFKNAMTSIPIFATEWSSSSFDGADLCFDATENFLNSCSTNDQAVSWCFNGWFSENENFSTLKKACDFSESNITSIGKLIIQSAETVSKVKNLDNSHIAITSDFANVISINTDETGSATISTATGTSKVVNIAEGDNKINAAPGLYIVNLTTASASRVEKVLVK